MVLQPLGVFANHLVDLLAVLEEGEGGAVPNGLFRWKGGRGMPWAYIQAQLKGGDVQRLDHHTHFSGCPRHYLTPQSPLLAPSCSLPGQLRN